MKRRASQQLQQPKPKRARLNQAQFIPAPSTPGSKAELKAYDIAVATYQCNTTGSFTLLCVPQLGTDYTNRIGRKINLRSVYIRGQIFTELGTVPSAGSQGSQFGRMIIFYDKQPNGAAPAVTDLLVSASPSAQLNLNNRDRFEILADKTWVFDPYFFSTTATQSYGSASRQIYAIKKYKKLGNRDVIFGGNAGTIADINTGALYMFFIGDQAAAGDDLNAIVSTRVRFDDS